MQAIPKTKVGRVAIARWAEKREQFPANGRRSEQGNANFLRSRVNPCVEACVVIAKPGESAGQLQRFEPPESRHPKELTMTKTLTLAALLSVFAASTFAATPASAPAAPMDAASAPMKKHHDKKHKAMKADKAASAASAAK